MSGIPAIVPQTLRTEATRVQNQLKVLINNYGVIISYNYYILYIYYVCIAYCTMYDVV